MSSDTLCVVGTKYSVEILCATRSPKSAQELSDELDIPIATCYRRIDDLLECGLLTEDGSHISDDGRRTTIYRRTVDRITVELSDRPELSVVERSEAKNRLFDSKVTGD